MVSGSARAMDVKRHGAGPGTREQWPRPVVSVTRKLSPGPKLRTSPSPVSTSRWPESTTMTCSRGAGCHVISKPAGNSENTNRLVGTTSVTKYGGASAGIAPAVIATSTDVKWLEPSSVAATTVSSIVFDMAPSYPLPSEHSTESGQRLGPGSAFPAIAGWARPSPAASPTDPSSFQPGDGERR